MLQFYFHQSMAYRHVRDDLTQCIQDGADSNPSPKVAGTDILLCSLWGSTKQASSIYELFAGYH